MADLAFEVSHRILFGATVTNYKRNLATPPASFGLEHRPVFLVQGATNYKRNLAGASPTKEVRGVVLLAGLVTKAPTHGRIFLGTVLVDIITQPRLPGDTAVEIVYNIPNRLRIRPRLIAPPHTSQHRLASPVMRWTPTVEAAYYEVHVATDINFTQRVARYNVLGTELQRGFPFGATYYWRVRAVNGSAWSDYSEVWSFTVPPIVPALEPGHDAVGRSRLLTQFREDA